MLSPVRLFSVLLALACAGCGAPTAPTTAPTSATIGSRSGLSLTYGMKRVQLRLTPSANQSLPAFESAQTVVVGGETLKIGAEAFDADWLSKFSLTSGADEKGGVVVFLRDAEGRLVGSGIQPAMSAGGEIPLTIVENTAKASIIRSLDDNNVADSVVIRATPLEMSTGYFDALPGVDHVDIEVSGPAYGDGKEVAKLGTLKAPNLSTYQWQPSVASGTFDPNKLAEPSTPLPFYLTTRAFDVEGHEVGVTTVKIAIVGTATVTIGVDQDQK